MYMGEPGPVAVIDDFKYRRIEQLDLRIFGQLKLPDGVKGNSIGRTILRLITYDQGHGFSGDLGGLDLGFDHRGHAVDFIKGVGEKGDLLCFRSEIAAVTAERRKTTAAELPVPGKNGVGDKERRQDGV